MFFLCYGKHQRNQSANGKIMNYMEQTFLYPNDFDTTLYMHPSFSGGGHPVWRGAFPEEQRKMYGNRYLAAQRLLAGGELGFHDYCGRWKAPTTMQKRFFAPVMLSCAEGRDSHTGYQSQCGAL